MNKQIDGPAPSVFIQQPRGLLRLGLRLPIWLYHLHLGWLLGHRFLQLTHTGRRSGLSRQTVIEVMRYDKTKSICVVASGWGSRADWFRNIQQTSKVTVTIGSHKFAARAVFLSESGGARELLDYARCHPIAFRVITSLFMGRGLAGTEENCLELAKAIPIVAFYLEPAADE